LQGVLMLFHKMYRGGPNEKPLIQPTRQTQADILGVAVGDLAMISRVETEPPYGPRKVIDGEVYTDGSTLILLTLVETAARRLVRVKRLAAVEEEPSTVHAELNAITPTLESEALDWALKTTTDVLGVELTRFRFGSPRFDELKAEGREPPAPPSAPELTGARLVMDRLARQLAIAIKTAGGLLVRDLAKQLPSEARDKTDDLTSALKREGLVDSEIVVVCGKTQAQVARAPSRDALADLSARGIKCACGRPIGDERTEEALTITNLGRSLLDKARWLTILLLQELEAVGVPGDAILIDQSVGGDEMDCLANIGGEVALFELKDKEFNLGNAYSFGAKIGIIRPEHPVIVTTEKVGNDAKEHFVRAKAARGVRDDFAFPQTREASDITYIEGVECLGRGVRHFVSKIYRADAVSALNKILPLGSLNGFYVLDAMEKAGDRAVAGVA